MFSVRHVGLKDVAGRQDEAPAGAEHVDHFPHRGGHFGRRAAGQHSIACRSTP